MPVAYDTVDTAVAAVVSLTIADMQPCTAVGAFESVVAVAGQVAAGSGQSHALRLHGSAQSFEYLRTSFALAAAAVAAASFYW